MRAVTVTRVAGAVPPDLTRLHRQAAVEGYSFVERTYREWLDGSNRFDRVGEGFFVAGDTSRTIGMCGLNRDPFIDDPEIGRLRHLYVSPEHRRRGIGRELVMTCLELAAGRFRRVRLRTFDDGAARFYERLGFLVVDETDATHAIPLALPPRRTP